MPPGATLLRAGPVSLNGIWELALAARPEEAAAVTGFGPIEVPGLWTMQGFAAPQYTNVQMPFDERPPHVPEANPTGVYRRRFDGSRGWHGRRVVLHFGGSEGALFVTVNGAPVGIAKDARTPAEFDVSELVRWDGPTTSSSPPSSSGRTPRFVEDQDQWWHAGLPRDVFLYATPREHIADVFARGDMHGHLVVDVDGGRRRRVPGCSIPTERCCSTSRSADGPARARRARAATVVGRAPRPLHARRDGRRGRGGLPRRLPQRRGRGPAAARQRRAVLICGVNRHDHDDTPRQSGRRAG